MMIPLTNAHGKHTFGLSVNLIWCVERDAQNPLITRIVTTMNGPKGLLAYEVMETPEEVIELIARANGREVPRTAKIPENVVKS